MIWRGRHPDDGPGGGGPNGHGRPNPRASQGTAIRVAVDDSRTTGVLHEGRYHAGGGGLVLPNGSRIGHRSLRNFYKQKFRAGHQILPSGTKKSVAYLKMKAQVGRQRDCSLPPGASCFRLAVQSSSHLPSTLWLSHC